MTGAVNGGWDYIWAAYIVTWLFFVGYAIPLWMRTPARHDQEAE